MTDRARGAGAAVIVGGDVSPDRPGDVHRLRGDLETLHAELLARGPYDHIVDESTAGNAVARWQLLVFHVAPGGTLLTRLPSAADAAPRTHLLGLVDEIAAARARGARPPVIVRTDLRPRREQDVEALAASLSELSVDDEWVRARRSSVETVATVPERHFNDLTARRPEIATVLTTVPAVAEAPELVLREHHGVVLAPQQIAYVPTSPAVVLPVSFRRPGEDRPRVRSLVNWSRRSVLKPTHAAPVELDGAWFYLDNVLRGHFGHAMTEQLSLAWAWDRARRRHPDLRALAFARPGAGVGAWEHELFSAAGIDDYEVQRAPVLVETLLTTTPAYAIGDYVHPLLHDTWATTGSALEARAHPGPRPARLFLSRPRGKRTSSDAAVIEDLAVSHGFTVVQPETLPLATQVAMVRSADVVAGYAGSALFHLALTARSRVGSDRRGPMRVIVVASNTYHAHNEQQICSSLGYELTLVRGTSHVQEGSYTDLFHSDYALQEDSWAQLRDAFAALDHAGSDSRPTSA